MEGGYLITCDDSLSSASLVMLEMVSIVEMIQTPMVFPTRNFHVVAKNVNQYV